MKSVAYRLERAENLSAVSERLQTLGWAAKPVAGGQSLGAMLNLRLAQPEALIDLDVLPVLRAVHEDAEGVTFGAMTTHAQIEDGRLPDPSLGLMPRVARGIAYRAVRNRGTIGGSLCHADPAADWVSTLPLLGATLLLQGAAGQRRVPAASFVTSAFETCLQDGEVLVAVFVPRLGQTARWSYRKFCRKTGEFAKAIAACLHDPTRGTERVVLGALDGPPLLRESPRLFDVLRAPGGRSDWLAEQLPSLETTRRATLAEMLRLAVSDLENDR